MEYRPRTDSTDVELDSDDRWLTRRALGARIDEVLREHEHITVGIMESPLQMSSRKLDQQIDQLEPLLRHLQRMHTLEDGVVFHWTVAELIAHRALHEWWAAILRWPLGWWLEDHYPKPPPPIPEELR